MGDYFRVPADSRDLNYSNYYEDGSEKITEAYEYNSDNTNILTVEEIKEKLLSLEYVRTELNNYKKVRRIYIENRYNWFKWFRREKLKRRFKSYYR